MGAPVAARRAARLARRAAPVVMEAYRRWQRLPPEERERYVRRAREYGERGRQAVIRARERRLQRASGRGRRARY
jgi:acyl-CoA reductase-like NAD-dependent aldehyde dehydrogenase